MTTFRNYMPRKAYENVRKNGDKLAQADSLIEWEAFRPIIAPMYRNRTPRGGEARIRRSRDGSWAKKGRRSSYGYKLHTRSDVGLIRDLETTTASVHDSRVDLSVEGEVVYRDKGYFGVEPRGYDATMRRGVRGRPLDIRDRLRNKRINGRRAPGERPFAVIKRVFGAGHVLVTTVPRVHVKMIFACFCFNLMQLGTLAARP